MNKEEIFEYLKSINQDLKEDNQKLKPKIDKKLKNLVITAIVKGYNQAIEDAKEDLGHLRAEKYTCDELNNNDFRIIDMTIDTILKRLKKIKKKGSQNKQ